MIQVFSSSILDELEKNHKDADKITRGTIETFLELLINKNNFGEIFEIALSIESDEVKEAVWQELLSNSDVYTKIPEQLKKVNYRSI